MVALGKEQDVVAHRCESPPAERAAVRRRFQVLRAPELPPARFGVHFLGATGGFGQEYPVPRFRTRQLLAITLSPERTRATLRTSLATRTT
jgi:hypothetical protein